MASEEQRPLASTPQESPRMSSHTPLPTDDFDPNTLHPRPAFMTSGTESPRNSSLRNSYAQPGTPTESGMLLANKESMISSEDEMGPVRVLAEQPSRRPRRSFLILIALIIIVVILIAIIVPVYFTVIKPKTNAATVGGGSTKAASPTGSSSPKSPTSHGPFSGGDGSTVRATNGSTFTYVNKLGGICECVLTGHEARLFAYSIMLTVRTANRVL
jgi:glucan 1,3-beta-glucosidase